MKKKGASIIVIIIVILIIILSFKLLSIFLNDYKEKHENVEVIKKSVMDMISLDDSLRNVSDSELEKAVIEYLKKKNINLKKFDISVTNDRIDIYLKKEIPKGGVYYKDVNLKKMGYFSGYEMNTYDMTTLDIKKLKKYSSRVLKEGDKFPTVKNDLSDILYLGKDTMDIYVFEDYYYYPVCGDWNKFKQKYLINYNKINFQEFEFKDLLDRFETSEEEFRKLLNDEISFYDTDDNVAWNAVTIDKNKENYGRTLFKINGKDVCLNETYKNCKLILKSPKVVNNLKKMNGTYDSCINLIIPPILPETLESMIMTFNSCESLTETPQFPENISKLKSTFLNCKSLNKVNKIPLKVKNMSEMLSGCISLERFDEIPSNVEDISLLFLNCKKLKGKILINSNNLKSYANSFKGCESKIYLDGTCKKLKEIQKDSENNNVVVIK